MSLCLVMMGEPASAPWPKARVQDHEQRRSHTLYRVRAVIEALNEIRRGSGVAAELEEDRRRRSSSQRPGSAGRVEPRPDGGGHHGLGSGGGEVASASRAAHANRRFFAITSREDERMASGRLPFAGLVGSVLLGTDGEFPEEHRWWCDLAFAPDRGGCQRYEQIGGE